MFKKSITYKALFIIFALLCLFSIYDYISFKNERKEQAIENGIAKREEIKDVLTLNLDTVETEALAFAELLSKRRYSKKQLENLIKKTAESNPFALGITVALEPKIINDSVKELFAPFYSKKYDEFYYIEESYDYTNDSLSTSGWYTNISKKQSPTWSEPYIAQVAQELVIDYGIPFYKKDIDGNKTFAGVVSFTISSAFITEFIHSITLGKTGFAFLISKNLKMISHPSTKLLTNPELVTKILKDQPVFNQIVTEKEGHFSAFSTIAQENAEYFYTTFKEDWVLSVVIPIHDLIEYSSLSEKKLIIFSILLSLALIFLTVVLLKVWQGDTTNLWVFSLTLGMILLSNITFIWYLKYNSDFVYDNPGDTKILSQNTINNYVNDRNKKLKQIDSSLKSLEIPTGIFLYDIDFKNAYDVAIIGKIWQKIPDSIEQPTAPSFVFPQASATGISVRVRPMLTQHIDKYWLYRYDFNATIQFDFDYLNYPLNVKKLDLQIKYPNKDYNVILTPDISDYDYINPSMKPGVSEDIYMPNSKVLSSYFSFHEHNFYSNLGNSKFKGLKETPILTFNVLTKNIVLSAIISNVVPIFIIALLIFLLPFTVDKKDGEIKEGGSLNIIQAAAGFFFVLLLAHIQLRNTIETPGIKYLETFYFVMYFMLAIMATAVMLFLKTNKYPILEYKHNLIFKISYWPILLTLIYLITLFIFY